MNNQLQDLMIDIFKIANSNGFDLTIFSSLFLKSETFNNLQEECEDYYFNSYKEFTNFITTYKISPTNKHYSNDIAIYMGHIYGYFIDRTKEKPNKIIQILKPEKIIANYDLFHTLSEEKVIFIAKYEYNLKLNAIRKQRSNSNKNLNFSKNDKNLFIAKHLYNKLFFEKEFDKMNYRFNEFPYLVNDNALLITNKISLFEDIYKNIHNKYDIQYNIENSNKVLFLFSETEIILDKDIKQTLINKKNCTIPFDKILIYDNKKIIFSSIMIPTQIFYLDINKLDIKQIENDYKNRYKNN